MLKICEECGYEYSSHAKICPKCGCPNFHISKEGYLKYKKSKQEDEIGSSIACIVLCIIFYFIITRWFGLKIKIAAFMISAIFASLITSMGIGIIGACVVLMLLSYFFTEVLHLPESVSDFTFILFCMFPLYYMFVRPIRKIMQIRKTDEEIGKVHFEDVIDSNEEILSHPRTVNENTQQVDEEAIDAEFTEHE